MTSNQQRAALQRQIWQIANDSKGADTNESLNTGLADVLKGVAELKTTVARIDQLRSDIDTIVAEIEGGNQ